MRTVFELGEMKTPGPWVDSPRRSEWEAQNLENVVRRRPNGVIRSPVEILLFGLFTLLPELSNSPLRSHFASSGSRCCKGETVTAAEGYLR